MRLAAIILCLLLVVLGLLPAAEPDDFRIPPGDIIVAIAADLRAVDPETARTTRYLSLANLPSKEWDRWDKVTCGHLQELSRRGGIYLPVRNNHLLRIDIRLYGEQFQKTWELLGKVEPFFHDELVQEVEENVLVDTPLYFQDGRWYNQKWVKKTRVERVRGLSPYLVNTPERKKAMEYIQSKTGGTDVPVVYADWFLYQTAVQFQREPAGYYDFLGVKDLQTYEKITGVIRKEIDPEFLKEAREAIANSTVTTPETLRRIVHFEKTGGDYWFTQDSNQKLAGDNDKSNPITNLGDDYEFQAIEAYSHLPNGFWAYGLFNNKGVLQTRAPPEIATDRTAPYTDTAVHVCLSCIRCHTNGGMQDIDGWVRNVQNRPPNYLATKDPKDALKLREQYVDRRLEPFLKRSRDRYSEALLEATGLTSARYADLYAEAWRSRCEEPVTLERAARDLGCKPDAFRQALIKADLKIDPMLATFRDKNPRPIPVATWHKAFAHAQDALHGAFRPVRK